MEPSSSFTYENPHNIMLFEMGKEYLESAKRLEGKGKIELAYKYYKEAANKFFFLAKDEVNEQKKKILADMMQKAVDSGIWVK